MSPRLNPRTEPTVPDTSVCREDGCNRAPTFLVTTAGGRVPFCDLHVRWYQERGERIYPTEPIPGRSADPRRLPLPGPAS